MTSPLRFVFGLHLHQPVGNFDHVMADHVRDVYRPIIEHASAAGFFPLTLHVSGPLLEWLEAHDTAWLDMIGRLAADRRLELLLAGFDEPILASLPRPDRLEQIGRMREYLQRRFGVQATGLWLTERVWQPELAADLAAAGVEYALVDDRHFLVSGFRHDELHRPHHTESDGQRVGLLAIDERLRYLIPFRPPEETASYLKELRAQGHGLAVLADDGEKFGGWPGTKDWVYGSGWLATFLQTMEGLITSGEIELTTGQDAFRQVPSGGLAYLGTASYREMEKWALPPEAQRDLTTLEDELGPKHLAASASFVRGGHWHHFLVKYPESNRMHKTMVALSTLSRRRGDPPEARRAIGRAQCNDAYWHGVFGGLYLPHLRNAIWRQLAIAERALRQGEGLAYDELDLDYDGYPELWIHSAQFSAVVSPHRGGAVEVLTRFADLTNFADVLTRRRESYHEIPEQQAHGHGESNGGTASIHDIEKASRLTALPPVDVEPRAILVERLLGKDVTAEDYANARYKPIRSWAAVPMSARVSVDSSAVTIVLQGADLEKRLQFDETGCLDVAYSWNATAHGNAVFAPELSLARDIPLRLQPDTEIWRSQITTVARSERGFEETVQGVSLTPRWPARLGNCSLAVGGGASA
ncbi:MAG TPA: alpha-amylase/4-alpha-glucanotransferase domain-containing protein [Gemmatimonadales bacterium]|jgi:alpha-amylase|nr:alpha-amylase/4-alpha-glucanotransferase domain-containing protein [Gemmatimonadales bacterium]